MINFLKNIIKKNFFLYDLLIKILSIFKYNKNWKVFFYNTRKDLKFNFDNLNEINKKSSILVKKQNDIFKYKFNYAIFELLSKKYSNENLKILEIGTFDGFFSKHLSQIFPKSQITTIDLKTTDNRFITSYKRQDKEYLNKFLERRAENLKNDNIRFIESDSVFLPTMFKEETFDFIWVDGDHSYPVVEKDIYNSYLLAKKKGYVVIDDVSKIETKNKFSEESSYASYSALEKLKNEKKINYFLINKLVRPENFFFKSNIAFFQK
jgi:predicted O-methyltransferase YrrM